MTLITLAVALGSLIAFAVTESRVAHPLLPMRVPANRNRGASFLAMLISAAAMFGGSCSYLLPAEQPRL